MSKKIIFTNGLIDLAQPRLGSKVIFKTDDFFASAKRIIEPTAPVFKDGLFDKNGKWMDGWESRRKRTKGHDYIILTEYLKICNSYPNLLASKIVFENNSLSDKGEILDLINKFKALGYNGKKIGGDNYELKAKSINFNYLKENQQ